MNVDSNIVRASLWNGICVKEATPIRARCLDADGIRAASYDGASVADRSITTTRSLTLFRCRPVSTQVSFHARWGLSSPLFHHYPLIPENGYYLDLCRYFLYSFHSYQGGKRYNDSLIVPSA